MMMRCRHCETDLKHTFLDLGFAPPSNAYLSEPDLKRPELHYPLRVLVCESCWLVQTEDCARAEELFSSDYAYFSSTSSSWLAHSAKYAQRAIERLGLGAHSRVIEVACNDGYLLSNFVDAGIPCLGIEPTASTARAAEALGIPVIREFFGGALGQRLAGDGLLADLIVGNNVYAHVPDINDFTRGLAAALAPGGTITLEFPHVMQLVEQCQFDTVYHEHFSYLSLYTTVRIMGSAGLRVWDVEELGTHGGSLRIWVCHHGDPRPVRASVARLLDQEKAHDLQSLRPYLTFQARAERIKDDFLSFLLDAKRANLRVAAYGAAAKGNTLLNFAGVGRDLLSYVCDAALAKQGRFMPGSHVPIRPPDILLADAPDLVVILPWNLASEVRGILAPLASRGTRFVTAVPRLEVG